MKRILVAIMIGGLAIVLEACTPVSSDPAAPYYPTYTAIAQGLIDSGQHCHCSICPAHFYTTPLTGPSTYVNEAYGFAFDYPPGWEVIETIVPKGTRYVQLSNGRYAVGSEKYDVLVVDAVYGPDWTLEINAIMKPDPAECCGGQGPVPYPYDNMYQPLEILGRSAARHRPEDGYAWIVPEPHEPYPVLVMFLRVRRNANKTGQTHSFLKEKLCSCGIYMMAKDRFPLISNTFQTSLLKPTFKTGR